MTIEELGYKMVCEDRDLIRWKNEQTHIYIDYVKYQKQLYRWKGGNPYVQYRQLGIELQEVQAVLDYLENH